MSTFGLLCKTIILIEFPFRFEVSLKRSILFYKKLEELPWVKHEYAPFVWGRDRRRGSRFNREGGLSLKYNSHCDPYILSRILHNVNVRLMEIDDELNIMRVPPECFLLVIHGECPSTSSAPTITTKLKNQNVDRHKTNAEGKQINDHFLNRNQNGKYTTKMNNMSNDKQDNFKRQEKLRQKKYRELKKTKNMIDNLTHKNELLLKNTSSTSAVE